MSWYKTNPPPNLMYKEQTEQGVQTGQVAVVSITVKTDTGGQGDAQGTQDATNTQTGGTGTGGQTTPSANTGYGETP